jgi:hypothetical protein
MSWFFQIVHRRTKTDATNFALPVNDNASCQTIMQCQTAIQRYPHTSVKRCTGGFDLELLTTKYNPFTVKTYERIILDNSVRACD